MEKFEKKDNLNTLTDEELCSLYQKGIIEAFQIISERYRPLLKKVIRPYFLVGATDEDLFQEAFITLYKTAVNFKTEKNKSFKSYAMTSVRNKIVDTIREYNNCKSIPLKYYTSIENAEEILSCAPEDLVIEEETRNGLIEKINNISSPKEKKIVDLFLKGLTYSEIAEKLGFNIKTVYNSIARIKFKLSENNKRA